jgi:acyl-CoA synthetase (AMP-forming)/AMP-acid ligase II
MSPAAPDTETMPALLAAAVANFGDDTAVVQPDGSQLTYSELAAEARSFGGALVAAGVEAGDRVAIWAPNSTRWIIAALGIWEAGAALVPVNTRLKGAESVDIIDRSGARLLVTVTDFLGTDYVQMMRDTGAELADLDQIVVAEGPERDGTTSWESFTEYTADPMTLQARASAVGPEDTSDILFTSGTTGVPKGVVQKHHSTRGVASDWVAMTGLRRGDRYLMVNPYFHMFGLKAGILPCITVGATMIPEAVFDVERTLQRVSEEKVTVLPGPPTLYQSILDHPALGDHDLSTLRFAVTGAADIPVELIRRMYAELPFELILTGYGLTESGTAAATSADDDAETIATTVGNARPGMELRLVDGDRNDVAPGETGEILLRGKTVMSHYLDNPEATAEAFGNDGWMKTGDLGALDKNGNLQIVGRSKDMIIVGGFNVYPAEVENLLLAHPGVREVAVIGRADVRLGEVPMAFVVPSRDKPATPDEIIEWSRENMANFKAPRFVEFIDELPLNATGKVVKDELRKLVADQ